MRKAERDERERALLHRVEELEARLVAVEQRPEPAPGPAPKPAPVVHNHDVTVNVSGVTVQPGDLFVVGFPSRVSDERWESLVEQFREHLPKGVGVLSLECVSELAAVSGDRPEVRLAVGKGQE